MNELKFTMERVSLLPSLLCNLHCRMCSARIPYVKNARPIAIDRMKEINKRLFNLAEFIGRVSISGGEPLLYAPLPEYVDDLARYGDSIGELEIYTNGTIVPSERLLCAIRRFPKNVFFRVDHYGANVSTKLMKSERYWIMQG